MISFIHSPDEPADFVREIAILLPEGERKALFARMLAGKGEATKIAAELYERMPEHSLDLNESLQRIEEAANTQIDKHVPDSHVIAKLFAQIRSGTRTDWRELFMLLDRYGTEYDAWDRIMIAGHIIAMDLDGMKVLIPRAPLDDNPETTHG